MSAFGWQCKCLEDNFLCDCLPCPGEMGASPYLWGQPARVTASPFPIPIPLHHLIDCESIITRAQPLRARGLASSEQSSARRIRQSSLRGVAGPVPGKWVNLAKSTKRRCQPCPRKVGASSHLWVQPARSAASLFQKACIGGECGAASCGLPSRGSQFSALGRDGSYRQPLTWCNSFRLCTLYSALAPTECQCHIYASW